MKNCFNESLVEVKYSGFEVYGVCNKFLVGLAVLSNYNRRAIAGRFLSVQAMVAIGLSILCGFCSGKSAFCAALWGGACGLLPTGVSIWILFKRSGARKARQIVGDFYKGEALKFFTTVILITVALCGYQVSGLPFLLTYIGTVLTIWLSPFVMR